MHFSNQIWPNMSQTMKFYAKSAAAWLEAMKRTVIDEKWWLNLHFSWKMKNVNRLIFEIDTLYDQIGHKQWKNDSKFNFLQSITFKLNYK